MSNQKFDGEFLKDLRLSRGWSLEAFSTNLDDVVSKQALNSYETGAVVPSYSTLQKICQLFNIPPEWLTEERFKIEVKAEWT